MVPTCIGAICGAGDAPVGTPISMQTLGDCQEVQCNGNGGTQIVADPGDPFDDGEQCTINACDGGMPTTAPAPAGDSCTEGTGQLCDGSGVCVECLAPTDCASLVCDAGVCLAAACDDGVENGGETDTDCGGPCNGCPFGGVCAVGTDCQSGVCTSNVCQAACGDGSVDGLEQCDDGNADGFDGCSATCVVEADHVLLSEVKRQPTSDEFIEIHNPTNAAIDLTNYYLADYNTYYLITTAAGAPVASDFRVRFPAGTMIGPHAFLVVSLESATSFFTAFGFYPDLDFSAADANAPDMLGQFGASSGLTDTGEMVVLFAWDGVSPLVVDVDYMNYTNTAAATDKTGLSFGGQTYLNDTPIASQIAAAGSTLSMHRCDTAESTEVQPGNGIDGADQTSENGLLAWKSTSAMALPSPKAAPPAGFCP
jgi:cysteine-rich repeat protein